MFAPKSPRSGRRSTVESLESRRFLSASIGDLGASPLSISPAANAPAPAGYSPARIRHAYGFDQISFNGVSGNGAGQTIAIVDAFNDPHIASDLGTFSSKYGLPAADLAVVGQTGSKTALPKADADWSGEIALDVEWAHAIASAAKIVLVEAKSDSLADLLAAVDTARNYAGVSVVSMSWGTGEFFAETAYDSHFTTPAGHTPVTFVAASGDQGTSFGAMWPASSSNVLSVGGTTLLLDSAGDVQSESAWRYSTGGLSRFERAASYESAVTGSIRSSSPDVAFDADPRTGFAVYDSAGSGGWTTVGGTSAGAPQWAALIAIANQGRAAAGLGTLDGAAATLPTLYSLYNSGAYAHYFSDVPVTTTRFVPVFNRRGWFVGYARQTVTTMGYDIVTGLGTPEAAQVVSALLGATGVTMIAAAPANVTRAVRLASVRTSPAIATAENASPKTPSAADTKAIPAVAMSHTAVATPDETTDVRTTLPNFTVTLPPAASATNAPAPSVEEALSVKVFTPAVRRTIEFAQPRIMTTATYCDSEQIAYVAPGATTGAFSVVTRQIFSAVAKTAGIVSVAVDPPVTTDPAVIAGVVLLLPLCAQRFRSERRRTTTPAPFNFIEPVGDPDFGRA